MAIPIFEALDQVAHGRGIARRGPRPVVDWRIGDCPGRKARFAGIEREWDAEPHAERRGDEIDFGPAVAAE
jgi:hypothetical protein